MSRLPPPPLHPSQSSSAAKCTAQTLLPPPPHPANGRTSPRPETSSTRSSITNPTTQSERIHSDPPTPVVSPSLGASSSTQQPPLHPASLIARSEAPPSRKPPPVPPRHPETIKDVLDTEQEDPSGSPPVPGALTIDVTATTVLTPAQGEAIKQQLEDDEINWYLESFEKHVQHIRVASKTDADPAITPMPKPHIKDFTFQAIQQRILLDQQALREAQEEDTEGSETASLSGNVEHGKSLSEEKDGGVALSEVDWWAYAAAYARYMLGPPTPSKPHEPFSIPRFKSNAERLYVVALPAWQMIMTEIGDLCLWKNTARTLFAIVIITSSFLSTSCLLILFKLVKTRFFPPSPLSLYQAAVQARRRLQEAEALTDEVTGYDEVEKFDPSSSSSGGKGIGIGIDLSKARKGLGIAGEAMDLDGKSSQGKKGKRQLRKKLKELEVELGPGAVVVLGDIADVHEKVKNLFMWRSSSASTNFAVILAVAAVVCHFTPVWFMVKLVQVALGVVAFVVVPMISAQERYEPCAWLIGSAPTDSDHAMQLIRRRAAAGKPIMPHKRTASRKMSTTPSILSSITDPSVSEVSLVDPADPSVTVPMKNKGFSWNKVLAVSERGANLLESSRQYATGEKGIELKLARAGETLQSSSILTQMKLGSGLPGLVLTRREGPAAGLVADAVSYLAQYRARPGNLSISTAQIHFKPFITLSKDKEAVASASDGSFAQEKEVKEREITILMEEVVGIKKRDKTTLLVVVSAGLEIELKDGRSIRFAFVANRDQAFNRLVASSQQAFAKV